MRKYQLKSVTNTSLLFTVPDLSGTLDPSFYTKVECTGCRYSANDYCVQVSPVFDDQSPYLNLFSFLSALEAPITFNPRGVESDSPSGTLVIFPFERDADVEFVLTPPKGMEFDQFRIMASCMLSWIVALGTKPQMILSFYHNDTFRVTFSFEDVEKAFLGLSGIMDYASINLNIYCFLKEDYHV